MPAGRHALSAGIKPAARPARIVVAPSVTSGMLPVIDRTRGRTKETRMANWRQLAMSALLADGTIDEREVEILRKEFFADRRIDRAEMEFLLEARRKAGSAAPSFEKLIFEALRS